MLKILATVDHEMLVREVSRLPLVEAIGSDISSKSSEDLAAFLIAYYGLDLLSIPSIRHCVLTQFPLTALNKAAISLGRPEVEHVYDAALIVANAEWSVQSTLPHLIKNMFESEFHISLPLDYLPRAVADRPPTIEEVWTEQVSPLMEFQREVSDQVFVLLNNDGAKAMIQMPTGSGKTRTVMDALARHLSGTGLNMSVLWLAHSEELCEQAINTFRRSWILLGLGRVRIYRLWGDHMVAPEEITGGLIVAGLQKLVSLRTKRSPLFQYLSKKCTALIFDEAHKALATTYTELLSELCRINPNLTVIGLSATPGRSTWNSFENKQLAKLFNNKLISPDFGQKDPVTALREMGVLAHLKRVQLESSSNLALLEHEKRYLNDYLELPTSVLLRLSKNTNRNKLIITNLVDQVKQGNPTIVFACSVEHSKIIAALAALQGVKTCAITSDMTATSRARCIEGFRNGQYQAIVNYGILSTGFDAPNTGAVMIARPTASIVLYSQMIGRGMRGPKVGGRKECTVIDIKDNIEGFGEEEKVYQYFSQYWN